MKRGISSILAALVATATVAAATPKFTSVWKTPTANEVSFAGKKVAALVLSQDESLRVAGEEALARQLTGLGVEGVPTYRFVPREEIAVVDKAKGWFERNGVEGVVALRPVSSERQAAYTPTVWASPSYGTLWGYYGYGWTTVYVVGGVQRDTVVVVETTIYSVPRDALLWAGVSETRNPEKLGQFVQDLVGATVKELQKVGLAKRLQIRK